MPKELNADELAVIGPVLLELRDAHRVVSVHWVDTHQVVIGRVHEDGDYTTDLLTATVLPPGCPGRM